MPQLLRTYILRNAEQLSQQQIDTIGIQSHPLRLRSDRFLEWDRACNAGKYKEVEAQLRRFYEDDPPTASVRQLPPVLSRPLEFARYHGYKFTLDQFLQHIDANELSKEFGRITEDGRYPQHTSFIRIHTELADRLLIEAKVPGLKAIGLTDKQQVLS